MKVSDPPRKFLRDDLSSRRSTNNDCWAIFNHIPTSNDVHLLFQLTTLGAKSLDLSWQIDEFKRKCVSWDKYDVELNALNFMHTKK